jgi:uncharacterized protein (TIGR03118 family)
VDAYDANTGFLVSKIAVRGDLNAPWGIAQAPPAFGAAAGDILVGNFGDGTIHAYRPHGFFATPEGSLNTPGGTPIVIDGLWALEFGNGNAAGPTDSLFFTAGPNDENDGLFGSIRSAGP